MTRYVFVYGTLRSEYLGVSGADKVCDAVLLGYSIYHLGGFPGIIPAANEAHGVFGEVWQLPESDARANAIVAALDRYEGCYNNHPDSLYLRKEETVQAADTTPYVVNTYVYNMPIGEYDRLVATPDRPGDDWIAWRDVEYGGDLQ